MGALSRLVGRVDRRSRCRSARLSACRHGQSLDRGRGGMAAVRLCGSSRTGGALGNTTRYDGARGMSMTLNIDAIRREVRALDYARGSTADAALLRDDAADARANPAIEAMAPEPDDCALFAMLREEAVPPHPATAIVLPPLAPPPPPPPLALTPT